MIQVQSGYRILQGEKPEEDFSSTTTRYWLLLAPKLDVLLSTTYAETARKLWLELEKGFAQQNAPRICEIQQEFLGELINYEAIPSCSCGGLKTVLQNQQRDWIMKFLMGLNDSYKELKAQILLIKSFPSLNEGYSIIQQEEKRRLLFSDGIINESMALLIRDNFRNGGKNMSAQRKDKYYCTCCKMVGHSLEKCFKANPKKPTCSYCQMLGHAIDK
ncbi:uncharacterized protein LOC111366850 [Olea europaea var. sylvestris]|uniref:uncharacterized protein LOC111366850 n=1 Tax=Olea europaea var. sylvestris TaxID=158386 RepID=UPI000C1D1BCA|nr:uncharacterized protein LOC111366850 [Olea europaea var. sylvestris]